MAEVQGCELPEDLYYDVEKEEEALFPVLGNYIGTETGPVHIMLIEHKNSRELSSEFKLKINGYQQSKDFKAITDIGNSFIKLLSEHIDKEENILFNMADIQLSQNEKHGIMVKMLAIK